MLTPTSVSRMIENALIVSAQKYAARQITKEEIKQISPYSMCPHNSALLYFAIGHALRGSMS